MIKSIEKPSKRCVPFRDRQDKEHQFRIHSINLPDDIEHIYRGEFIQDYRSLSAFVRDMIQLGIESTCTDVEDTPKMEDRGELDDQE